MTDKQESRRIRADIRRVLLEVWDPIGIKDEPAAQDEYDSYVGGIFELLVNARNDEELNAYLFDIAQNRMGLNSPTEPNLRTIAALRAIRLS